MNGPLIVFLVIVVISAVIGAVSQAIKSAQAPPPPPPGGAGCRRPGRPPTTRTGGPRPATSTGSSKRLTNSAGGRPRAGPSRPGRPPCPRPAPGPADPADRVPVAEPPRRPRRADPAAAYDSPAAGGRPAPRPAPGGRPAGRPGAGDAAVPAGPSCRPSRRWRRSPGGWPPGWCPGRDHHRPRPADDPVRPATGGPAVVRPGDADGRRPARNLRPPEVQAGPLARCRENRTRIPRIRTRINAVRKITLGSIRVHPRCFDPRSSAFPFGAASARTFRPFSSAPTQVYRTHHS